MLLSVKPCYQLLEINHEWKKSEPGSDQAALSSWKGRVIFENKSRLLKKPVGKRNWEPILKENIETMIIRWLVCIFSNPVGSVSRIFVFQSYGFGKATQYLTIRMQETIIQFAFSSLQNHSPLRCSKVMQNCFGFAMKRKLTPVMVPAFAWDRFPKRLLLKNWHPGFGWIADLLAHSDTPCDDARTSELETRRLFDRSMGWTEWISAHS